MHQVAISLFRTALGSFELARWKWPVGRAPIQPNLAVPVRPGRVEPQQQSEGRLMPIVFIHSWNSEYLQYALAQARVSNPDAPIYLLGDAHNNAYAYIEHRPFVNYFEGARHFETLYKDFSTNGAHYELFCFQRWFILRDFLTAHALHRCLYLDSDILLYADADKESAKFSLYDFTLTENFNGCTFFLNRKEALDYFCQFVVDLYSGKERYLYDRMVAYYATRLKHGLPGGVSDMIAFQLYREVHFGEVGEASEIIDGSLYDPAITSPFPGFEMENGLKKIFWRNEFPYGKHIASGKEFRFNSLHFQGASKTLMPSLVQRRVRERLGEAVPASV